MPTKPSEAASPAGWPAEVSLPRFEEVTLKRLNTGILFPDGVGVTFSPPNLPVIGVVFEVRDGVPELMQLTIRVRPGEPALTASILRDLALSAILDAAVERGAEIELFNRGDDPAAGSLFTDAELIQQRDGAKRSRRRRIVDDALLRQVLAIVKADRTGAPTKAVADRLHTSHRNATRWIALAREAQQSGSLEGGQS